MTRLGALLRKELLDLSRNRGALLPVAITTLIFLGFHVVVLLLPRITGTPLGSDRDLRNISAVVGPRPELSLDGRVQLFLFQQFLILFLLMPITGAMSLASHAIVGEKQARTLEPLLATPITTGELLVAKVLGALIPTLAISIAGLAWFFVAIALFAEAGVLRAMLTARTWILILFIGPAAALVSLQSAIVISSRVNDARTAQQFGVLIILPITAVLVAQFTGSLWLSATALALAAMGLVGVWILLTLFSVALFEREAILTRWK
jgi:ABC-2 type transport system permease protein